MTGSGMPMRFADTDGTMIDVYQAATQMTDESDQSYPLTPNTLLDNALGPWATTAHSTPTCTPTSATDAAERRAASLRRNAHGVPMVSGKQMVDLARRPERLVVLARSTGAPTRSASR